MEIYFHTGPIENPVPLINYLWKKYSLQQQIDKKFGNYITYFSPQGVEINFNSQYIRLKDDHPFWITNKRKIVPESSPLRPLLEDLIKQFGSRKKIVTVVGEAVETAGLMKDLLPSSRDIQSEQ